ncbi:MAG: hypothetical protein HC892_09760 [Saprospiraceae bacterium]|nr:hypothetical protein [Saprospiraceae bacterium]
MVEVTVSSSNDCLSDCSIPVKDSGCDRPATFTNTITANPGQTVNWNLSQDFSNQRILVTGGGIVIIDNGDLLLNSDAVVYVENTELRLENGNLQLKSSGARFIMVNGILRTSANVQVDESNTFFCITNSDVEIGDEIAPVGITSVSKAGRSNFTFSDENDKTAANFQNVKGYSYFENVCINVTQDFQTKDDGTTYLVGVCLEVGDRGANNATTTPFDQKDGDDTGSYQNAGINGIYGTQIAIANGNFQNEKNTMTVCDVDVRVNGNGTGSFQVNDGTLQGTGLCIAANDLIQNQGNWTATVRAFWARNSGLPVSGPVESTAAQIDDLCFESCCTGPSCSLNTLVVTPECVDNGTNDYIKFTLSPTGTNTSTTYSVTAVDNMGNCVEVTLLDGTPAEDVAYAANPTMFRLPDGTSGSGKTYTITVQDDNNVSCNVEVVLNDPGSCDPAAVLDYGDLADSGDGTGAGNYETQSANGGPSHVIDNNIKLGATIDSESDGQPSALADGDGADEDDVTFPTFVAGHSPIVTVSLMNMTGGNANLYGFIDFNNDGDFDDMGEAPAAVVVADNATSAMITFNVPAGAVIGTNVGARFRLTTDDLGTGAAASEGAAGDGEVEDYLVRVEAAVNPITLCPQGVEGVEVFTLDFDTDDAGNTLIAGTSDINIDQPYDNIFGGGMGITFASGDPSNNPLNLYNSAG